MTLEDGRGGPLERIQPEPPNALAVVPVCSRWKASAVTFGPAGRIVATSLVLFPVFYGIFVNAIFLLAGVIWMFLLPTALRDIWKGVRSGDELRLRVPDPAGTEPSDVESIANRKVPPRW